MTHFMPMYPYDREKALDAVDSVVRIASFAMVGAAIYFCFRLYDRAVGHYKPSPEEQATRLGIFRNGKTRLSPELAQAVIDGYEKVAKKHGTKWALENYMGIGSRGYNFNLALIEEAERLTGRGIREEIATEEMNAERDGVE